MQNSKFKLPFKHTLEIFIIKAKRIHGNKYDYSKVIYINDRVKVIIICPEHGEFEQSPNSHLRGVGCPGCKCDKLSKHNSSNIDDFKLKAFEIHGNRYGYDDFIYTNSWSKGKIKCNMCETIFEQIPNAHLNGRGCPICKSSKGERFIIKILNKNNIKFVREYIIPNQQYKFRYDFYLPEYNILIEFHGIQHYEARDHFGGDEGFHYIRKNDIFKKELAKLVKIPLIEFNYKHLKLNKKKFEKIILFKISKNIFKQKIFNLVKES